jgi:hypothetical protein
MDEVALDALKEPMHIATHKLAPSMLKDQVGASVLMEKPIHVTANEPTANIIEDIASVNAPMKKPINVATNELDPCTLKEQVQTSQLSLLQVTN